MRAALATLAQSTCFRTTANVWNLYAKRSGHGGARCHLNGQMSYPIADALAARGVPFVFSTGYDKDTLSERYRTFPVLQSRFNGRN